MNQNNFGLYKEFQKEIKDFGQYKKHFLETYNGKIIKDSDQEFVVLIGSRFWSRFWGVLFKRTRLMIPLLITTNYNLSSSKVAIELSPGKYVLGVLFREILLERIDQVAAEVSNI